MFKYYSLRSASSLNDSPIRTKFEALNGVMAFLAYSEKFGQFTVSISSLWSPEHVLRLTLFTIYG